MLEFLRPSPTPCPPYFLDKEGKLRAPKTEEEEGTKILCVETAIASSIDVALSVGGDLYFRYTGVGTTFRLHSDVSNVKKMVSDDWMVFVLTEGGDVFAMGKDIGSGISGMYPFLKGDTFTRVHVVEPMSDIEIGNYCAFMVSEKGRLYAYGGLYTHFFTLIETDAKVLSVMAGDGQGLFLTAEGKAFSWNRLTPSFPVYHSEGELTMRVDKVDRCGDLYLTTEEGEEVYI